MDDPNITMEEYIRLEEVKSRRRGKVYNWKTATYGKIWCNEDVHDIRSVESEFLAIFYNDALTSEVALSCEPTLICLRFRHMNPRSVILDDFDYFKDFEKEFPAIAYNDALTSELDFSPEPTVPRTKTYQAESDQKDKMRHAMDDNGIPSKEIHERHRERAITAEEAPDDLDAIYKLVMDIYQDKIPEGFDKVLWGDLIVMFNPDEQDEFLNSQHEWKAISWKLHSSS
ncbi:hypothetical protein Tco_1292793, partial [Tanacetum coccineum]